MKTFRLSSEAKEDIASLLDFTYDHFGSAARLRYETLIVTGLTDIASDAKRPGVKERPELGLGVCSYHLRYSRDRAASDGVVVRRPRHLLLFRPIATDVIGVGRVLYDAMEIERHLPANYGDMQS